MARRGADSTDARPRLWDRVAAFAVARPRLVFAVALAFFGLAAARFSWSALLVPLGIPINIEENLGPLFRFVLEGQSIERLGPRQYGVVAFLLVHPVLQVFGDRPQPLSVWALVLCLCGLLVFFIGLARRLAWRSARVTLVVAGLWLASTPIIDAAAMRLFDLIVMGFLGWAYVAYTGRPARRAWAGVPVAAGFLTKLLPAMFLPFLAIRERRSLAYGLGAVGVLLLVGQAIYGWAMGFGYLVYTAQASGSAAEGFSLQNENNSLRGLLFRVAAGFRLTGGGVTAAPSHPAFWNVMASLLSLGLLAYLLVVVWQGRRTSEGVLRRSVEFAFALLTMMLVSPHTAHEHMVHFVVAMTIGIVIWGRRAAGTWPRWLGALGLASIALVGVYLPATLVARLLFVGPLMHAAGNEGVLFAGSNLASYNFLGFPGLGLIMGWVVFAVLERRTRGLREGTVPAGSDVPLTR